MEIKVHRPRKGDPLKEGLTQLDGYLDRLGLDSGTLLNFDRRPSAVKRWVVARLTTPGIIAIRRRSPRLSSRTAIHRLAWRQTRQGARGPGRSRRVEVPAGCPLAPA